jgi:pSer/pThr/pTyr-binding forkhead associated (FHA) protein
LAPPSDARWEAVATADRDQFDRLAVPGLVFPDDYGERRFALDAAQVRIGRSRRRVGEPALEIDLAGVPEDPAISRLHALLERQDDGTWTLRDLGSTNGTTVNDNPHPIGTEAAVVVTAGDRIRLGAWTTITVRADQDGD